MLTITSHKGNAIKNHNKGLSWWLGGEICLPAGFNPRSRKVAHAAEQLSLTPQLPGLRSRAGAGRGSLQLHPGALYGPGRGAGLPLPGPALYEPGATTTESTCHNSEACTP